MFCTSPATRGDSSESKPGASVDVNGKMEYGSAPGPLNGRDTSRGPGAFCTPGWEIHPARLVEDINRVFLCIAQSSGRVTRDSRRLRRICLDFYLMGRTRQRPTLACWEELLQLQPTQTQCLRATLMEVSHRPPRGEDGFIEAPNVPLHRSALECDVSDDGGEDDSDDDGSTPSDVIEFRDSDAESSDGEDFIVEEESEESTDSCEPDGVPGDCYRDGDGCNTPSPKRPQRAIERYAGAETAEYTAAKALTALGEGGVDWKRRRHEAPRRHDIPPPHGV
ncbi:ORF70 [Human alphaherpesvirus 3]|uniref:Transcriptional regulator ICP22 homolog n=25 Tax=Human herpesvirus 3 TaxID=10335 RepID=ICP22_VZVD|nr:regulatory protein ICP22 [Human alphaherpesvirus 3]NP_040192.1 regulatory protein ICP22 [Human alphaherpesvirus 3]P09255.1 RecName: Full=Transcriptional regulator ICP22 homolog; AltName: Full=Immediate-early protein 63; Short=IE63; AltName: Full=Transcriptional regulator IE63 [Human herpesvirus 3 strain Dumas]Q77NN7.1 RecName: Full=Transcriptional regulator ICP22 homolog; AltName: Full=Immediate-early protein 63; Short=IE63; AltName: Full=Transcriptional transactivator IE63 [Human herpesvirus